MVDHISSLGPTITHVRGTLMANTLGNLRDLGMYDEYARLMPKEHLEVLLSSVAASWIPVEHVVVHYDIFDRLPLTQEQFDEIGARQARRVFETFLGGAMRRVRGLGIDGLKQAAGQLARLHERIYQGGGCTLIDTGPKDLYFEIQGFPFAVSRAFRTGWLAYCTAFAAVFTKVAYVRPARPREPHPHRLALTMSWV